MVKSLSTKTNNVYNIAMLDFTTPTLLFVLNALSGRVKEDIHIATSRKQINLSKMPDGWYGYDSYSELADSARKIEENDCEAKYVLWLNDLRIEKVFSIILPILAKADDEGRVSYRFISEGISTNGKIKEAYPYDEDWIKNHEKYKNEWVSFKSAMKAGKVTSYHDCHKIIYAAVDYENQIGNDAKWLVAQKNSESINAENEDLLNKIINDKNVTVNNPQDLFNEVRMNGSEYQLKEIFHFNDDKIIDIINKGKIPMIIIGTAPAIEESGPIKEYVKALQDVCSKKYELLYKPHPINIKESYDINGIDIIDGNIPIELFTLFYPEIIFSGYPSTTFQSLNSDQIFALFDVNKKQAYDPGYLHWIYIRNYIDGVKYFMSKSNDGILIETNNRINNLNI